MNSSVIDKGKFEIVDVYAKLTKDRIIFLAEEIDAQVATTLVATLLALEAQSSTQEITLYLNSPGGTVSDGLFPIYDVIQSIKAPVRTICLGEASSSAAVILASGSKGRRQAYPHARIMLHSVQGEVSGSLLEVEQEIVQYRKLNHCLMELIARHTGQSLKKIKKDCCSDKFLTAEEAQIYGIIDEIILPQKKIPALKE